METREMVSTLGTRPTSLTATSGRVPDILAFLSRSPIEWGDQSGIAGSGLTGGKPCEDEKDAKELGLPGEKPCEDEKDAHGLGLTGEKPCEGEKDATKFEARLPWILPNSYWSRAKRLISVCTARTVGGTDSILSVTGAGIVFK